MASAAAAIDQAANPKSVDESLWWDSFVTLLNELENAPLSGDLPSSLVEKLKSNHAWFLGSISLFKPPNQTSRSALDSPHIAMGSHRLLVRPDLKEAALQLSSVLCLDEVQAYILVNRSAECNNLVSDYKVTECLHLILLQFSLERECLLKCTRQILMHALSIENGSHESDTIMEVALQLVRGGLERQLYSVLQSLLSYKLSERMVVDFASLWMEEIFTEVNLVLEILFLAYYESFCTCDCERWKSLCSFLKGILSGSFNIGKLAMSAEAENSFYHAKVQLLLILIETLDLDNLLRMVHDEVPFRHSHMVFSSTDVLEMDAIVSSLNTLETAATGPLSLAWAVFFCLISSLPEKQDDDVLAEIDHTSYVRQGFDAEPLSYFLEILDSNLLRDSDVAGYRSVLRTFISAFIASYEITHQLEDNTPSMMLDILCKIYRGEESLCMQFWDRDSIIDGPIRCLLFSLEGEFPFRTRKLIRLLSALCEGSWPAECVYNFLNKMVGVTSLFEITPDSCIEYDSHVVETCHPLLLPGVEGLIIPSRSRGRILKFIDGNIALIRWEYMQSGAFVLLLRLAQEHYLNSHEDVFFTLELMYRMVSSNAAVCFALLDIDNSLPVQAARMNGHLEQNLQVDVVKIICSLVSNMVPNVSSAGVMSMGINILSELLKCSPSHVVVVALRTNIFNIGTNGSSSGMWLLSGGLARMLLVDHEQNGECCSLTISVLDLTMRLLETGAEDNVVAALVVFSLQYVLVNHEHWKYKLKHVRWKVTLKVLEVVKKCIKSIRSSHKLGSVIRDILLSDSSIHNTLCRIMCITSQTLERLYVCRLYELEEIEGLQLAICSVLDIVFAILVDHSKDVSYSLPSFHQAMLSSATKPIPVVTAIISLMSFRNPLMQVAATRVLSLLCIIAGRVQPYSFRNLCIVSDDLQITDLSTFINDSIYDGTSRNEDLFIAVIKLLTSAACYQPAFLLSMFSAKGNIEVPLSGSGNVKLLLVEASVRSLRPMKKNLLDSLLQYVNRSEVLVKSHPQLLLNVLNFLKAMWQGASQYMHILDVLKNSTMFWERLVSSISKIAATKDSSVENLKSDELLQLAYSYLCQSAVLEIMVLDWFLQKRMSRDEMPKRQTFEPSEGKSNSTFASGLTKSANGPDVKDILLSWCESSVMDTLIKLYAPCRYDYETVFRAKMAASLFVVHVIGKLSSGDAGSLSISLVERIHNISKKLREQPSFSELLAQYSLRGYSEEKELKALIISDLYYHLQGQLEGRDTTPGPFKELSQYLLSLEFFQNNVPKHDSNFCPPVDDVYLFDTTRLEEDLGLKFWDNSYWNASKAIAERMLQNMHDANLRMLLAGYKLSALKALTSVLFVHEGILADAKPTLLGGGISEPLMDSCIDYMCKCLQKTLKSFGPALDASDGILNFLGTQAELLLSLVRISYRRFLLQTSKQQLLPICVLVIKTSGGGLRMLSDIRPSTVGIRKTVQIFLTLLLTSVEISCLHRPEKSDKVVDAFAEVSLTSLGLLPVLCNCIETAEYCNLSLAAIDIILRGFSTSNTWLPILQKHLRLQLVIYKLQQEGSLDSIPIILKFLLTLARVRGGSEMLLTANFFSSLKMLFTPLLDDKPFPNSQDESGLSTRSRKEERPQHIWGLGLAIVTALINSLGDDSSCADIVDSAISYFFSEKAYLVCYYLSAPDFPTDDYSKKRARTQKTQTSLTELGETEYTLMLICVLANYQHSWIKAVKEMDSQLRERSIHLLAFISKGAQRIGESPSRTVPLLCPPILKEEVESNGRPSFVNSKHGWFALTALGCLAKAKASTVSSTELAQLHSTDLSSRTYFSDVVAIQIYRIAFLLLKFLCLQAKAATKRAEEVGFVDLAHFPELPMPEILHGLQDQAIAIVSELCEANKLKSMPPEIQDVCFLMLQIMEKALYLELCVLQTCGIRPVLGRVEDFSKEIKALMQVAREHTFLKASLRSLKQIIALVYPGLLQTEVFM